MKAWLDRCDPFLRLRKAASTLEYSLVLGVVLAGIGGVLIAFSQDINEPILQLGASASAFETLDTEIGE